jgi:hypothetical protein
MGLSMLLAAKHSRFSARFRGWRVLFFALLATFAASFPAAANTTIFTSAGSTCTATLPCWELSNFGLLTGQNDTLTLSGSTIQDSVGVVSGGKLTVTGTNTLSGGNIVDFADTVTRNSSCTSANLCGAGTLNGSLVAAIPVSADSPDIKVSPLSKVWAQEQGIYNWLNTTVSGYTTNTFTNATTLFNAEAANAHTETDGTKISVYKDTTAWTDGGNVVIGCGAGGTSVCAHAATDIVVVLLTSTSASNLAGHNITINANSGLTSDQVVFMVNGTLTDNANNATTLLAGVYFFGPNAVVTLGTGSKQKVTLDGRLFGGQESLTATTQGDQGTTPEPGTWAMLIGGLGLMFGIHYRRQRASR